jgi:hypothetical protein
VKLRLQELRREKISAELSELFVLQEKVRLEMLEGRNLLKQMAERTRTHIKKASRRLTNLRQVNEAGKIEASERFGLNISPLQ